MSENSSIKKNEKKSIVIIGGRATGISAIVNLVIEMKERARIVIIDPQKPEYPSVFYDEEPLLLANTSHVINSIIPDKKDDFLHYLNYLGIENDIPRYTIGMYCQHRFIESCKIAQEKGIEIIEVRDEVRAIKAMSKRYTILLSGGNEIHASDVIIAIGLEHQKLLPEEKSIPPYPANRLRNLAKPNALVIGQGQSGIDAALVLCAAGSKVTMCSRSGQFPAVRTRTPLFTFPSDLLPLNNPADFRRLVDQDCQRRGFPALKEQLVSATTPLARLEQEVHLAMQDKCPWQDSIVGIIDALIDSRLSIVEDKEFLWRYVTAITLRIAQQLLELIREGKITTNKIESINIHDFDLIVAANGFTPPTLSHHGRTLYLGGPPLQASKVNVINHDLRLILSEAYGPERIWAIGPASGTCIPFANFLHTASRQAAQVAKAISRNN